MAENTKMLSQEFIYNALRNPLENQECELFHEGSCNMKFLSQFIGGCKGVYKMYLLAHLIPFLLFKRKKFVKNLAIESKKLLIGFVKSMIFAGGSSSLVRRILCLLQSYYKNNNCICLISPILAGIMILFQSKTRQTQIALFTLSKSTELLYNMALRRQWNVRLPLGQCWLNAVALAVICFTFMEDPSIWRESYRKVLGNFLQDI